MPYLKRYNSVSNGNIIFYIRSFCWAYSSIEKIARITPLFQMLLLLSACLRMIPLFIILLFFVRLKPTK